jgi:hypothetical protein
MNQLNTNQIKAFAGNIREKLHSVKLKETSLNNLSRECHLRGEDFYMALEWLVRENKIFFLVTPIETYVLPLG